MFVISLLKMIIFLNVKMFINNKEDLKLFSYINFQEHPNSAYDQGVVQKESNKKTLTKALLTTKSPLLRPSLSPCPAKHVILLPFSIITQDLGMS